MLQNEPLIAKFGVDTAEKCTIENLQILLHAIGTCYKPCRARFENEGPAAVAIGPPGQRSLLYSYFAENFNRAFLGCIDASDSESGLILQHFSKSTRFWQNQLNHSENR